MASSSSSSPSLPPHQALSASDALRLILRPEVMALDMTTLHGTTWLSKTIHGLLEVWATTPSFKQQWAAWLSAMLATDEQRRAIAARIVAALRRYRPVYAVIRDGAAGLTTVRNAGSSRAGRVGCVYLAFHDYYDRDGVHAWRKVYAGVTMDFRGRRRTHRVVRKRSREAAAAAAGGTLTQTQVFGRKLFPIARVNGDGVDDARLRVLMGQWAIGMWDLYAYQSQEFPVEL
ncbi:hypothetical protein SLS58_010968 [Diplodia intermedia]|uniref:Uncharacterized protein n=1 Tax=Diplodia intermedia TaxID=856260 RepID=A0ABR3T2C2_9PEZI